MTAQEKAKNNASTRLVQDWVGRWGAGSHTRGQVAWQCKSVTELTEGRRESRMPHI